MDDSGPAAGESFTLSATVKNDGEGAAAATTLRYYRSTDATIATSDTQVGTDAVAGLAAAGSSSQSVDLTAPDTSGTYYLRGVRGRGDGRVRHDQQLLVIGDGDSTGTGQTGPGGGGSDGETTAVGRRGVVHPVGDGEERWRGSGGGHDAALLPVDRRDDRYVRHSGRHGRGCGACGCGKQ